MNYILAWQIYISKKAHRSQVSIFLFPSFYISHANIKDADIPIDMFSAYMMDSISKLAR